MRRLLRIRSFFKNIPKSEMSQLCRRACGNPLNLTNIHDKTIEGEERARRSTVTGNLDDCDKPYLSKYIHKQIIRACTKDGHPIRVYFAKAGLRRIHKYIYIYKCARRTGERTRQRGKNGTTSAVGGPPTGGHALRIYQLSLIVSATVTRRSKDGAKSVDTILSELIRTYY